MDSASHFIDIFLYLMGTPEPLAATGQTYAKFAAAEARQGTGYRAIDVQEGAADAPIADVEELAVAMVQFEGGITLTIDVAWKVHLAGLGGMYAAGTSAGARVMPLEIFYDSDDGPTSVKPDLVPEEKTHIQALRHFVTSIREGRETESPGERSIVTMQIIEAIYESARREGQAVRIG
jgi:predicted dehydrogenase